MTGHYSISDPTDPSDPGARRLRLAGELDLAARDELRAALVRAVSAGAGVTVDLAEVTFLDSEALSALIDGYHAARDAGVAFRLTEARGTVRRVLEVTGVLTFE